MTKKLPELEVLRVQDDRAQADLELFTKRARNLDWDEWMLKYLVCSSGHWGGLRGWPVDNRMVIDMLADGAIKVAVEEIPRSAQIKDKTCYEAFCGGGSKEHGELKWYAYSWLKSIGEPLPEYEQDVSYGRCDVFAPKLNISVECGDTTAVRIADGLANGYNEIVMVLFDRCRKEDVNAIVRLTADDEKLIDFAHIGAFPPYLNAVFGERVGQKIDGKAGPGYKRATPVDVSAAVARYRETGKKWNEE